MMYQCLDIKILDVVIDSLDDEERSSGWVTSGTRVST